jgi:hypothetical protein
MSGTVGNTKGVTFLRGAFSVYWSREILITRGSFLYRVEMLEDGEEFGDIKEF